MKASWLILATLTCAPLSLAGTVKLLPSALEMPDHIGPLVYTGKPGSWPDPRLGMSYAYSTPGVQLDIYVYDGGVRDIPEGAVSRPVCEQFEQAKLDVFRGGYKDVAIKSEQLARMGMTHEPPLAREAVFEAVIRDVPTVSYLWITGAGGNFIKLRFSANAHLRYEMEDARRAVLNAVGDAIRPHLAAPAPAQAGKKKSIALNLGDPAEFGFSLLYLASISVQADDVPPCGGPLRPRYSGELAAFELALRVPDGKRSGTSFTKQLTEISKAGFLEEFVWTYRYQDFWGSNAPEGLDLAAFSKWSRKKLKSLKIPQLGYVSVTEPRELPVEP